MLATIRKWLLILIVTGVLGYLAYQGLRYRLSRNLLPLGTTIGGLNVSGMTMEEARDTLLAEYGEPVYVYHRQTHVELNPQYVGFQVDDTAMFRALQEKLASREAWLSYIGFVARRPLQPVTVPISATHDSSALEAMLQSVAEFLDQPAKPPQMLGQAETVREGQNGYVTDVPASVMEVEKALYRLDNRVAELVITEQEAPEMSLELLADVINAKLQGFDGMGSIFIMDLQTGEEIDINADVALSGLSILKIAIFVEAYRAIDGPPNVYQQQLFMDTATRSSNFGANLLLHEVAGENNTYKGADILTESMHNLGLVNTFMAVPYDASPPAYRQTTYVTPANSRTDIDTVPDPTMQSTAEDIGTLLAMIYHCSKGGGTLLAVYPDDITPEECQAIIDLMVLNEEGNLIRYGVPEGVPVSHKHGWALATHADAGIVFSPGGDYVLVEYLNQPGEWLLADVSFPILREIARATYNYFNMDNPYLVSASQARVSIDPENPFSEEQTEADPGVEEQGVTKLDQDQVDEQSTENNNN